MVGAVQLQHLEPGIDHFDETGLHHHLVRCPDTPVWHRTCALGHLVVRASGAEHRVTCVGRWCRVFQALLDLALPFT